MSAFGSMLLFNGCFETLDKHNQVLKIKDMIALSYMTHQQAIDYLARDKKSVLVSNRTNHKQQITEFSWLKGDSSVDIIKSQWQDGNQLFHSIHCDFFPVSHVKQIIAQLKYEGFHLEKKFENNELTSLEYRKGLFTISVYQYENKSMPLAVELHKLF
ncbi:hypothetical protein ACXZ1K_07840 [Pedobacter sp. PWIIR3]